MILWYSEIKDAWGKAIVIDGPEGTQNMTLRFAVVEALGSAFPDESGLTGEQRVTRWGIALKVRDAMIGDDVPLKVEELSAIKTVIPKRWPQPFIVAQVFDLIEQKGQAENVGKS